MPKKSILIDIELVSSLLRYDPLTGLLYSKKTGKRVGVNSTNGYIQITVKGRLYQAHRLAWCLYHGENPLYIDHINGNRADNRICNLRNCSERENMQNQVQHRNGKRVGANFSKEKGKWRAKIQIHGKRVHIGYYDTEEEACAAYSFASAHLDLYENYKPRIKNTKVATGITYSKARGMWVVRKQVHYASYYIGAFPKIEEAQQALTDFLEEMKSCGVLRGAV